VPSPACESGVELRQESEQERKDNNVEECEKQEDEKARCHCGEPTEQKRRASEINARSECCHSERSKKCEEEPIDEPIDGAWIFDRFAAADKGDKGGPETVHQIQKPRPWPRSMVSSHQTSTT
jgi:hypothetical protein